MGFGVGNLLLEGVLGRGFGVGVLEIWGGGRVGGALFGGLALRCRM